MLCGEQVRLDVSDCGGVQAQHDLQEQPEGARGAGWGGEE